MQCRFDTTGGGHTVVADSRRETHDRQRAIVRRVDADPSLPLDDPATKALFLRAIEEERDQRDAFLDEVCRGDPELRLRLERLLRAHDCADGAEFLGSERPVGAMKPSSSSKSTDGESALDAAALEGQQLGPYLLERLLGEGGFGRVYLARQDEPVARTVALKVLKPGMDSQQVITRFDIERQALARMDHPGIAKILDAGTTPLGRPFFVMEYVDGEPVTRFCDRLGLGVRERLEIFERICLAVHHAHQKGIIHRDLKPTNVLVAEQHGSYLPKVIDFGIAKAVEEPLTDRPLQTGARQLLGTPLYMSPEQARVGELDIDTRTDIYSLGVVLYELLTGVLPVDSERFRHAGPIELQRILTDEPSPSPSTRLSGLGDMGGTIAARRASELPRLCRLLRGDIDLIVLKAIDKDRERRYASPAALAADIRRFLDHEPIQAAPPSLRYRVGKLLRRHRVVASIAGSLLLALLIGSIGTTIGFVEASRNLAKSDANLALARGAVDALLTRLARSRLAEVPQSLELRRNLLEEAVGFRRKFLADNPRDVEMRLALATTIIDLGSIIVRLGDYPDAAKRYADARDVLEQLIAETQSREARLRLAVLHHYRVEMAAFAKDRATGSEAYSSGRSILEQLERESPEDLAVLRQLAQTHANAALLDSLGGGDGSDASDLHLAYRRRVFELAPESASDAAKFGVALHDRAVAHILKGEVDESSRLLEEAMPHLRFGLEKKPGVQYHRQVYGMALSTMSEVRRVQGEAAQAVDLARKAVEIFDGLIVDFPARADYRHRYAMAVWGLTLPRRLPRAEAEELLRKAFDHLENAIERNPDNQVYRDMQGRIDGLRKAL